MTITTPTKPSSFKRSSERDLAKQQGISEEKRLREKHAEQRRRDDELEALSYGVFNVGPAVVRPATMDEVFGNAKLYDDFGLVP
jgi:hypothetical protein